MLFLKSLQNRTLVLDEDSVRLRKANPPRYQKHSVVRNREPRWPDGPPPQPVDPQSLRTGPSFKPIHVALERGESDDYGFRRKEPGEDDDYGFRRKDPTPTEAYDNVYMLERPPSDENRDDRGFREEIEGMDIGTDKETIV